MTAFPPFLCHSLPGPSASLPRSRSSFVNAISSLCPRTTCDFHPSFLLPRLSSCWLPIGEAGEPHLPVCLSLPHCRPSVSRHAHTDDRRARSSDCQFPPKQRQSALGHLFCCYPKLPLKLSWPFVFSCPVDSALLFLVAVHYIKLIRMSFQL